MCQTLVEHLQAAHEVETDGITFDVAKEVQESSSLIKAQFNDSENTTETNKELKGTLNEV